MSEREREKGRERGRERERKRKREKEGERESWQRVDPSNVFTTGRGSPTAVRGDRRSSGWLPIETDDTEPTCNRMARRRERERDREGEKEKEREKEREKEKEREREKGRGGKRKVAISRNSVARTVPLFRRGGVAFRRRLKGARSFQETQRSRRWRSRFLRRHFRPRK